VPGELKRIAAAEDGTVWGVMPNGSIWRLVNGQWAGVPGQLVAISVGSAQHIIGANAGGQLWRWDNASSSWHAQPVSFEAAEPSIGKDGTLYALSKDGKVYRLEGSGQWTLVPGSLTDISVYNAADIVGCNAGGQLWRLVPFDNNRWAEVAGVSNVSRVSNGASGVGLVLKDQSVKRLPRKVPAQFAAHENIDGQVVDIAVGNNEIIGCNAGRNIWRKVNNGAWSSVAGKLTRVDLAEDGTLWGVGEQQQVMRHVNGAWVTCPASW
jgi:hypothetical protein